MYFNQSHSGRYIPRAVLVDLDPGGLDAIRSDVIGALFNPDDFVYGNKNSWKHIAT